MVRVCRRRVMEWRRCSLSQVFEMPVSAWAARAAWTSWTARFAL